MRFLPAIFLWLWLPVLARAQSLVRGTVVMAESGKPLAGANVFIANSAKGTTSDAKGSFELADIPPGRHELVVSFVGYETSVYPFSSEQLPLRLRVEMRPRIEELDNVTVEPSVEEGWDKWGRVFLENFVGLSENAAHCRLLNTRDIRFRFYRKSNRLIAYSDKPIKIENRSLGYYLHFQLEDFEVNFRERSSVFTGYPLFEEMAGKRNGRLERWKRNREKAYYGSMMHFMRAVYQDSLAEAGFLVRRLRRTPNLEKKRVQQIYRMQISGSGGTIRISSPNAGSGALPDSTAYYERVLGQPDLIDEYGASLLTADSLLAGRDGNYKAIYFPDYLSVIYPKALEEEGYLQNWGERRKPSARQSMITLLAAEAVWTDINGNYFPARRVFSGGYWGWSEKIANLLPLEYRP